jgi:rhodanese-related sulfurtransferase
VYFNSFTKLRKYDFKDNNDKEFFELIKSDKVKVLDVRTNSEFVDGHIENAINIDISDSAFLDKCKSVFSKNDIIAVYCYAGSRSRRASDILSRNGFNVVNLKNGIVEWKKNNFPVVM